MKIQDSENILICSWTGWPLTLSFSNHDINFYWQGGDDGALWTDQDETAADYWNCLYFVAYYYM
jgi:hypothetical protein